MILFLLVLTATFRPAAPTVGDLITIDFRAPVVLDASPSYEIVSQSGSRVVVRAFDPKPFALSGVTGGVRFRNLVVPMKSVLKPKDSMEPAPLKPPIRTKPPNTALVAIAIAAGVAALLWTGVVLLALRLRPAVPVPAIPPAEKFRAAVALLRTATDARWAGLADAMREYLAARDTELGEELTTSEVLRVIRGPSSALRAPSPRERGEGESDLPYVIVADVLRLGDLEKFSPWGAPAGDFDTFADRALALIEFFEPPPAEEEAAA